MIRGPASGVSTRFDVLRLRGEPARIHEDESQCIFPDFFFQLDTNRIPTYPTFPEPRPLVKAARKAKPSGAKKLRFRRLMGLCFPT